jgi:DNA-binding FadR family transcriptional regulator
MTALPAVTQAHALADRVRNRIQSERLTDGSLFMTADQLAAEYDVSRTVAREAVCRLQALGILEARKRTGLIVRRPDPLHLLSNSLPSLVESEDDWRELMHLRYALEVGAIELAVRNAKPEQIERLGQIVAEMEVVFAACDDVDLEVSLDVQFHALLLEMTGSRMIAGMQQVLVNYFAKAPRCERTPNNAQRIIWEHRELFLAVHDRDVERARSMVRMHFRQQQAVGQDAAPTTPVSPA